MHIESPGGGRLRIVIGGTLGDANASIDPEACRINIAARIPRMKRVDELRHELWHAWTYAHGEPNEGEALARAVSGFGRWFDSAFDAAGGHDALESLREVPTLPAQRYQGLAIADRVWCPQCGSSVMVGSVERGEPEFCEAVSGHVVTRTATCECGCIWTWAETCSPAGFPLGLVLPEPRPAVLCC